MLTSNVTAAVVFRAIDRDRPTLLMDEADTYFEKRGDEFRGIPNSGHTRDAAVVWRTVGDQFNPKPFSTWAPLAVAKIGKLPDTIARKIEGGHIVIPDWLAAMLRPFGIRPHSIRIGQSTPKGYMWKDFEDAFARYLPENRNSATSDEN
jgi:Protein of unknown function (DUF3631)